MAKQGSIRHYRQEGNVKAPASLPYGELAVAKDGTVYAGNEAEQPVALAKEPAVAEVAKTANAARPKTGGTFTGNISAVSTYTGGWQVRNAFVYTAAGAAVAQPCVGIGFYRK